MLVELGLRQPERQSRSPDLRHAHLSEQIRERADMLVPREGKTSVDDDDLAVEVVDGHVLADLSDAAQRDDAQGVCSHQGILRGGFWATIARRGRRRAATPALGRRAALSRARRSPPRDRLRWWCR